MEEDCSYLYEDEEDEDECHDLDVIAGLYDWGKPHEEDWYKDYRNHGDGHDDWWDQSDPWDQ